MQAIRSKMMKKDLVTGGAGFLAHISANAF